MFIQRPYLPGSSDLDQAQRIFNIFGRPSDCAYYHERELAFEQQGADKVSLTQFNGIRRTQQEFYKFVIFFIPLGLLIWRQALTKRYPFDPGLYQNIKTSLSTSWSASWTSIPEPASLPLKLWAMTGSSPYPSLPLWESAPRSSYHAASCGGPTDTKFILPHTQRANLAAEQRNGSETRARQPSGATATAHASSCIAADVETRHAASQHGGTSSPWRRSSSETWVWQQHGRWAPSSTLRLPPRREGWRGRRRLWLIWQSTEQSATTELDQKAMITLLHTVDFPRTLL